MIQIDIEMPEYCDECPCCEMYDLQENWGKCRITNKEFCCLGTVDDKGDYHRPDWCPLKEPEQRRGRWRNMSNGDYECTECGWESEYTYDYCPNCAAIMFQRLTDANKIIDRPCYIRDEKVMCYNCRHVNFYGGERLFCRHWGQDCKPNSYCSFFDEMEGKKKDADRG